MTIANLEAPAAHVAVRLAQLTQERAERKDELDISARTQREFDAYLAHTALLDRRIATIRTAAAALEALGSDEADVQWRDFLTQTRATCSAERLQIKSPIRDKALMALADNLEFSIRLVDRGFDAARLPVVDLRPLRLGQLMHDAGYATSGPELRGPRGWRGSLPEVEQRIKALAKQRTEAQARLDGALMTDEERTTRDAESKALNDAFNAMHVKMSGDPNRPGLVAYTDDGDVLDVADMTPLQRKAFERMDAAHRRCETVSS